MMLRRPTVLMLGLLTATLAAGSACWAGVSYDNASSAVSSTAGTTLSWSHAIGGNTDRLLVVGVAIEDGVASQCVVSSVTYNGVAMTQVAAINAGSTVFACSSLWYMRHSSLPAPGTYTIAVTTAGTVDDINGGAVSLYGVKQSAPEATASSVCNSSCANSITTSITTVTDNAWVVGVVACGNPGTYTPGGAMAERYDVQATTSSGAGGTLPVATAGSTNVSWTHTNGNRFAQVTASFAPARRLVVVGSR
jgi:hypothetical protein